MSNLQHKFKSVDSVEQYRQLQAQKITELRDKLVLESENKVINYLTSKYGSVKLERASKPDLEVRRGPNDNPVFDGTITVHTQLSAGAAARRLSMLVNIIHNTVSLPKYKLIDKIVASAKTEDEIQKLLPPEKVATNSVEALVDLGTFQLIDSDGSALEVYHSVYGEGPLGQISKLEYEKADKEPIHGIGATGTFSSTHSQALLAGKNFEVVDVDGDSLCVKVGGAQGWLSASELQLEPKKKETSPKVAFKVGDKVTITPALKEYYGDTIVAADLVGKQATITDLPEKKIVLAVDNISELVELDTLQIDVLALDLIPVSPMNPPKLESLLRNMIKDKFAADTSVKFSGKFISPTIQHKPARILHANLSTEETQMSPKELELKFKQTSGFDQFMSFEMQKIASKKTSLVEAVSREFVQKLSGTYSPVRIVDASSNLDFKYDQGYTGTIVIEAILMDKAGSKKISFSIPVAQDKVSYPSLGDIQTLVSNTESEQEKTSKQIAKELEIKLAAIDAEVAYQQAETRIAAAKPAMAKTASATMQPQEAQVTHTLNINKFLFPESLQVGAVVDMGDGNRYRLVSKNSGQLSKGPTDGSYWTFEHIRETSADSASYRVNNY